MRMVGLLALCLFQGAGIIRRRCINAESDILCTLGRLQRKEESQEEYEERSGKRNGTL